MSSFRKHRRTLPGELNRAAYLALMLIAIVSTPGCDPVRTVKQSVALKLTVSGETESLCRNTISMRRHVEPTQVDKERERLNPGRFASLYPWTTSVKVNESGIASLEVQETTISKTGLASPPKEKYPIENLVYDVRIEGCDRNDETVRLEIVQGNVMKVEAYTVRVLSVSNATYIEPEGRR